MPKEKTGTPKTFRPVGKTAERLNYAAKIGVNVNQAINRTLNEHLMKYLEPEIKRRLDELQKVLKAPMP